MNSPRAQVTEFEALADIVCERLAQNKAVFRRLPGDGLLRIDRQLPFLLIHRFPNRAQKSGDLRLLTTEAAYAYCRGDSELSEGFAYLCRRVVATLKEHFGEFLSIEVWATPLGAETADVYFPLHRPAFEILVDDRQPPSDTLEALRSALAEIVIGGRGTSVQINSSVRVAPPGLTHWEGANSIDDREGSFYLGLAVSSIYFDARTGAQYPLVLQSLRSQLSTAIRKAISVFAEAPSSRGEAVPYETYGPSSMRRISRQVDAQLCEISESFDFLLQATPANANYAWKEFKESNFSKVPTLYYRPLPYHPSLLQRQLFQIPVEQVEDSDLAHLFWDKQKELDGYLTALKDLESPRFLYASLQLYGEPDTELSELAALILQGPPDIEAGGNEDLLLADEIVKRSREEIERYKEKMKTFDATVETSDGIAAGMMVSKDRLLVSKDYRIHPNRLAPLLDHEIGTHLLTYFNGKTQPLRQLFAGLAGYEELQEGLAVLAEYLAGGLSKHRIRTFAARVVAVKSMADGTPFLKTFERLYEGDGFEPHLAFTTTLRAYRGGGLTKDSIYLRGFVKLLEYLASGHDIEPLYVGKIGIQHIPYVQRLRRRGIVKPPVLLPRSWESPNLRERLDSCRGMTVMDLFRESHL